MDGQQSGASRVSARAQIKHLHHELKVTTVYVTHDQIETAALADRVVVMNKVLFSNGNANADL